MKKLITVLTALVLSTTAMAQLSTGQYDVDGSLSIARGCDVYADNSAWLHIGRDTTKKGVILPNVILDSVSTTKRGLFVYDLVDSVLHHFDGTEIVRYMTYKDTNMIKGLNGIGGGGNITQGGNSFGQSMQLGTTDNYSTSIITNNTERITISNDGIATITGGDEEVLRVQNSNTKAVIAGVGQDGDVGPNIPFLCFGISPAQSDTDKVFICAPPGGYSTLPSTAMGFDMKASYLSMGNKYTGLNIISKYKPLTATGADVISLGSVNNPIYYNTSGTTNFLYVGKQFDSFIPRFDVTTGTGEYNMMYVYGQVNQTGTATGATRGIYINTYVQNATDWRSLDLGVNKGYGIYQSGSVAKNYLNGNTSFGSTNNTAKVDITGANGYDQLRLRTSYTPTSTSDTNGNTGDVTWDDSYIYIKTSAGWKRSALSTF